MSGSGTISVPAGTAPANKNTAFCGTVYLEKKADNGSGELIVDGVGAQTGKLEAPKMGNYGTYVAVTNSNATLGQKIVARNSFGNVQEATSNWRFDNIKKWVGAFPAPVRN